MVITESPEDLEFIEHLVAVCSTKRDNCGDCKFLKYCAEFLKRLQDKRCEVEKDFLSKVSKISKRIIDFYKVRN
jgi:hypothetical protein